MANVADTATKIKKINGHIEAQEKKVAEAKEEFKTINLEIIELCKVERNSEQEARLQKLKEQRAKNSYDDQDAEKVLEIFKEQLKQAKLEAVKVLAIDNIKKYNTLAEQRELVGRDIETLIALVVGNIDKLKSIDTEQRNLLASNGINSGYRAVIPMLEDYLSYKLKSYFSVLPRATVQGGLVDNDNMNRKINL